MALSALLFWLACPPVGLWPLAWIALAPLLLAVFQARTPRQAFWRGYLFGWLAYGSVWYWVGLTIVAWTGSAIGWLAWLGLTTILASFYGVWALGVRRWALGVGRWALGVGRSGIQERASTKNTKPHEEAHETNRETRQTYEKPASPPSLVRNERQGKGAGGLGKPTAYCLLPTACLWVLMEWARTWGRLTMPWAQLSYTQAAFLPVAQIAEWTGAYGVSFLMMLVNGAVAVWWLRRGEAQAARPLWATLTLVGFVMLLGVARMQVAETGTPLRVALMQDNFDPLRSVTSETRPRQMRSDLQTMERMIAQTGPNIPPLVLWSEGAVPDDPLSQEWIRATLEAWARQYHTALLVNGHTNPSVGKKTNSAVLFTPDGVLPQRYDKRQLVPFGEFIPYRDLIPKAIGDAFQFFEQDVVPGEGATLLRYTTGETEVRLGPFICYESMYPPYARAMTQAGANLLVTQSNDSWFQSRAAIEQHLQAVIFRAIENRRQVARATTSGITGVVDTKGRVVTRLPLRQEGVLVTTVRLTEGQTLYTRWGDWFVGGCGVLLVLSVIRLRRYSDGRPSAKTAT